MPSRVHEALIVRTHEERLVGHISRDSTEIDAREKPVKVAEPEKPQGKPGRPKKGEEREKEERRLERQPRMSLLQMLGDLPRHCNVGTKRNSKGYKTTWVGYKLHVDVADGGIPISCILTSASLHDSQVAIPLATMTNERVTSLYDLMDSAYDAPEIKGHSRSLGHVPIIDVNPRRTPGLKRELADEAKRKKRVGHQLAEDVRYNERSSVERFREDAPVAALPEFRLLERLLTEQCRTGEGDAPAVILREGQEVPSDSLQSPFDPDATYDGHKGVGYQAQISETCAEDNPIQVITRVEVELAHVSDQHAIVPALDDLEERNIAPEEMFADTAYNSGDNLIAAAERGVELMAPTPGQAGPDGITLGHFDLDLKELRVRACPEGAAPVRSRLGKDGRTRNLRFDAERCAACPLAEDCPAGRQGGRLRVHPRDIATAYSRAREESEPFKKAFAIRAGIESVNAALKTAHGLGKVWTRGLPRVERSRRMRAPQTPGILQEAR